MERLAQDDATPAAIKSIADLIIKLIGLRSTFKEVESLKVMTTSLGCCGLHVHLVTSALNVQEETGLEPIAIILSWAGDMQQDGGHPGQ